MRLKKIVGLVLATALCIASTTTAFAAGLTDNEQAILDKLKAGIEVNGQLVEVPASLLNQAENELMKNDTDITADQADVISSKMDAAEAIMKDEGITSVADLKNSASADEIVALVQDAASEVGYTVAYDAANGDVSVADPNGDTVFTTKNVINQTGFDLSTSVLVGGILVTLLAACAVVANKKKLFAKSVEA